MLENRVKIKLNIIMHPISFFKRPWQLFSVLLIWNFEFLFQPKSVAVIGASDRAGSVGATVMRNMLTGGFAGPIYAVNPSHILVAGQRAYPDVAHLPQAPDLAVIATPPATIPGLINALGIRGTRAAVVLTGGLASTINAQGNSILQAMRDAARPYLLRILGPNCVGLLGPGLGINASFAHTCGSANNNNSLAPLIKKLDLVMSLEREVA